MTMTWFIVTGEYPPDLGGVADYTRTLAHALVDAGDEVHVITRGHTDAEELDEDVRVTRFAGGFGPRGLAAAGRIVRGSPPGARILLQYVPHAFGFRSMNLALCAWAARPPVALDVMFHEVACDFTRRPVRNNVLAVAHRIMTRVLCSAADRIFVSTPSWEPLLRRNGAGRSAIHVLPIPSNLPTDVDPKSAAARRRGRWQIGHFGLHLGPLLLQLEPILGELLRREPALSVALIGRGSDHFASSIRTCYPDIGDRVFGTGEVPPAIASEWIASCDVMIQPYPDGATLRRTSLMASLALGVAVVTNLGAASEPWWVESGIVELGANEEIVGRALALLADDAKRERIAAQGKTIYREMISMDRTVAALRTLTVRS
jgi:glycosyltransferase involved in cell wall biosynthesis